MRLILMLGKAAEDIGELSPEIDLVALRRLNERIDSGRSKIGRLSRSYNAPGETAGASPRARQPSIL